MREFTRFFGNDGSEQPPSVATGAVRDTFDDAGKLVKRESFRANRASAANAQATAAIFHEMELANLGTSEGAVKGWESRRAGASGTVTEPKAEQLAAVADKKHGFTYYPARNEHATTGYVVAKAEIPKQYEQRIPIDDWKQNGKALLKDYADKHKELLKSDTRADLGAWYDDEGHPPHMVLDITQNIEGRDQAVAEGKRLKETAIWDVANKKIIRTDGK